MGAETGIQWASATWSPWQGCAKKSPGCANCYAWVRSLRFGATAGVWGPDGARPIKKDWASPGVWNRKAMVEGTRPRVFPSLCDWLEDRPDLHSTRSGFLDLIERTPNLDWLLLTKRPENWLRLMEAIAGECRTAARWLAGEAPANVWYGVSAEDQEYADERLPFLAATPAALRWVSYEPALGPIVFEPWISPHWGADRPLDWIVVGGESAEKGRTARPFDLAWARETIAEGAAAGVPVFVKQLGSSPRFQIDEPGYVGVPLLKHPKGGDPAEWPADLVVQQIPGKGVAA